MMLFFFDLEVFVKVVFLCELLFLCLLDKFICVFEVCFDRLMLLFLENFLESFFLFRELDVFFFFKVFFRMFIFFELMVVGLLFFLFVFLMFCKEFLFLRLLEEFVDLFFF